MSGFSATGPTRRNPSWSGLAWTNPSWRKMMLTLIGLVIGLIMLISLLLMLRYRPPRKDEAARLYHRFVRKTGLHPEIGETAHVFAQRVLASHAAPARLVSEITEAYMDTRYGCGDEAHVIACRQPSTLCVDRSFPNQHQHKRSGKKQRHQNQQYPPGFVSQHRRNCNHCRTKHVREFCRHVVETEKLARLFRRNERSHTASDSSPAHRPARNR